MREEKIYYSDSGEQFYDIDEACINDRVQELKKQAAAIYQKLEKITDNCNHNHMTIKAYSDTGNYCRSDDSYWYEAKCRACGKTWNVDQDEDSIVKERHRSGDRRVIIQK
ncbi:hypothetical protein ENKO_114 [Klebsiella phage fENko-Kae01]|uniref:hypothetical protein n=1 Tax=Salmonella enterica TaxID=28901 RepID=UPI0028F5944E|nr:hypothetical protein [Salmonella enterica]WNV47223.1 hypothetical protein [Klebsiella phage fENko-Kae01]